MCRHLIGEVGLVKQTRCVERGYIVCIYDYFFAPRIIDIVEIALCHSHEIRAWTRVIWPIAVLCDGFLQVQSAIDDLALGAVNDLC